MRLVRAAAERNLKTATAKRNLLYTALISFNGFITIYRAYATKT